MSDSPEPITVTISRAEFLPLAGKTAVARLFIKLLLAGIPVALISDPDFEDSVWHLHLHHGRLQYYDDMANDKRYYLWTPTSKQYEWKDSGVRR